MRYIAWTYVIMLSTSPNSEGFLIQPVKVDICNRISKEIRAWRENQQQRRFETRNITRKTQILQSAIIPLQMIIDPESLVIFVQGAQFAQERKILSRILGLHH